jgi:hypothetical protein
MTAPTQGVTSYTLPSDKRELVALTAESGARFILARSEWIAAVHCAHLLGAWSPPNAVAAALHNDPASYVDPPARIRAAVASALGAGMIRACQHWPPSTVLGPPCYDGVNPAVQEIPASVQPRTGDRMRDSDHSGAWLLRACSAYGGQGCPPLDELGEWIAASGGFQLEHHSRPNW